MMASFLDSLILTVVGLAVVFLVLITNALVTSLLKSFGKEKRELPAVPLPQEAYLEGEEPKSLTKSEAETSEEIEPEVVAAIAAALHYHMLKMSKVNYGVVHRTDVRRGL